MFQTTVAISTAWELMHRAGFAPQQPITRAAERDEQAIENWCRHQWPAVKEFRAGWARGFAPSTNPASR
jgi:hypothetical protein